MVKIKAITSLYHSELGNVNVGQTANVNEKIAEMLVKNGIAVIIEKEDKQTEPTKKKSVKKGE